MTITVKDKELSRQSAALVENAPVSHAPDTSDEKPRLDEETRKKGEKLQSESPVEDKYMMSGSKMLWHMDRIVDWQKGKRIAPLHIDAGMSKGCNIRCEYCYGATQGNFFKESAKKYFPREPLMQFMKDAGELGVRSIALIGEAEPTLNPHLYEAIVTGSKAGVDMSIGTNGILFDTGEQGEEALEHLEWIRFNISAASKESYELIHASKAFDTAVKKIQFCVDTKRKKNLNVTVGLQMVLTPNNVDQAIPLARLGRELGADYLVIKQCSDTVNNQIGIFERLHEYHSFENLLKAAERESAGNYRVIVKWKKITNEGKRDYDQCLGVPFLLYTSGDGKVYPCGMFFDYLEDEYRMGDMTKMTFKEIVESDRYWEVVQKVAQINVHKKCYSNCRTDCINSFLWKLKNPPAHVNFV